jgi:hypothetical protein
MEIWRPDDGMTALEAEAGEDIAKWWLGNSGMGKSPVAVQHAQEAAEPTGSLGKGAVLKVGYSFFQRSGTLSGHLLTKEGDLVCSKNALHGIDLDLIHVKLVKESPQMSFVLFECPGESKDVVHRGKTKVESPQNCR